ncbi:hypothetical protein I4U23_028945 [Adineta vaga]|nr:hypothetical protein I4U23_028945 [Adineta vaga]
MGIKGFQTFIEQKLGLLNAIELHNCNVLFDGNSIYHQMYKECHLTCLFGGEYDKFYLYCKQLFESFRLCQINVIVVFDGARLDDRKLATTLERSKKRIDYSTKLSVNIDLSPLLLRQTFLNVLDEMNIPYISALGEGDDECVSLANHLNCYLIARDSDYYCYNLYQGYVPFDYVDINPIEKDSYHYLSAQLFTIDSLLNQFPGLNPSTLSLACCLCGNDYIATHVVQTIFNHIMETVTKGMNKRSKKTVRTTHWYAMQWMKQFDDIEIALEKSLEPIKTTGEKIKIENKLRSALQSYLNPSDTLIYRFASLTNEHLLKNSYFVDLAREYLQIFHMNDEEIRNKINEDSLQIKSKSNHSLPTYLFDALTDLRLSESFIEILIHRRLICSAMVELEQEASIHVDAIPIILPCIAILLKWDDEQDDQSIVIYHRVVKQLRACKYSPGEDDEIMNLNQLNSLSSLKREKLVCKCLNISFIPQKEYAHIHSDYYLWLMSIHYWYSIRQLKPVYLYGIIISFVKSICLINDDTYEKEDIDSLSLSINDKRNYTQIEPETRRTILLKLKQMRKKVFDLNKFDCSIIHEFNCLQTIYVNTLKVNEFFNRPFQYQIPAYRFLIGSFFYAFVEHYETKQNVNEAIAVLFQKESKLLNLINKLYTTISSDIDF